MNRWNALNRENDFFWNVSRSLSLWQKHIQTKYLKSLSIKILYFHSIFYSKELCRKHWHLQEKEIKNCKLAISLFCLNKLNRLKLTKQEKLPISYQVDIETLLVKSGKLFLISVTWIRELSKDIYKNLKEHHRKQCRLKK